MRKKIYLSSSAEETKQIGERLAKRILKEKREKSAKVISLEGELGSGKTTFLKGFARGFGIKEVIKSPSFVIMRKYKLPTIDKQLPTNSRGSRVVTRKSRGYFYHIDCYRIEEPKEILALNWKEIIESSQNIVAIEWGDKIRKILPPDYLKIDFEFINKTTRKITFLEISTKNI